MRSIIILFFIITLCSPLSAETFIREYDYRANAQLDDESTARIIALERVKTDLLQEVGVYIRVTENRIQRENRIEYYDEYVKNTESITGGITKTIILDEKWNGSIYHIKAKIEIDLADFQEKLKALMENSELKNALLVSKNTISESLAEIERLKNELRMNKDLIRTASEQYKLRARYVNSEDYVQLSVNSYLENDSVNTIHYAQKSIELNPNNSTAKKLLFYRSGSGYGRNNNATIRSGSGYSRTSISTGRSGSGFIRRGSSTERSGAGFNRSSSSTNRTGSGNTRGNNSTQRR